VTKHPTSAWVIQQLCEAFPYDSAPGYLIFDRGSSFNAEMIESEKTFGIKPKRTSFRSPWQNGVAERWVGNCRCDLLDHVIVLNERHLKCLMNEYIRYYHEDRTHLALAKGTPAGREAASTSGVGGRIMAMPRLGIGAQCFAMLPICSEGASPNLRAETAYRYVDSSIRDLGRKFAELGIDRSEVQVKLFGGADVIPGETETLQRPTVGSLNCDSALHALGEGGFQVMASSLRGTHGRKIHFNTMNGEVMVHRLQDCSVYTSLRSTTKGRSM
jgi:chemotaxis receptor (MCP) glutamine deamidase CheD